jgi:superfamily II DNA/RNA helicase
MDYLNIVQRIGGKQLLDIQQLTINAVKEQNNIELFAPTGSGKTLAFIFGIIEALTIQKCKKVLIIAPSRELAQQISLVFKSTQSEYLSTLCYGGHPFQTERNNLLANPTVIIGTPGRIADHIRRNSLRMHEVDALVLDEEDKIEELGFQKEINEILKAINVLNLYIRVSASGKPSSFSTDCPTFHTIDKRDSTTSTALQFYQIKYTNEDEKATTLIHLLSTIAAEKTIVFFNHREAVERMEILFKKQGIQISIYHGGLEQAVRERNLVKFANGSALLLLVTDLAAWGLDIEAIENIVHYQLPESEATFLHRNGRTARMGKKGNVFCLLSSNQDHFLYLKTISWSEFSPNNTSISQWETKWVTLYISLGKKDKVNKIDILGFFTKKLNIEAKYIGKINSFDKLSFVAIDKQMLQRVLTKGVNLKLKNKKVTLKLSK